LSVLSALVSSLKMERLLRNKVLNCDVLEGLKRLPGESVNCVVTSPPYWGLRDYGLEPNIWGGNNDCEHEWKRVNKAND